MTDVIELNPVDPGETREFSIGVATDTIGNALSILQEVEDRLLKKRELRPDDWPIERDLKVAEGILRLCREDLQKLRAR
jgi:hypothetical protein